MDQLLRISEPNALSIRVKDITAETINGLSNASLSNLSGANINVVSGNSLIIRNNGTGATVLESNSALSELKITSNSTLSLQATSATDDSINLFSTSGNIEYDVPDLKSHKFKVNGAVVMEVKNSGIEMNADLRFTDPNKGLFFPPANATINSNQVTINSRTGTIVESGALLTGNRPNDVTVLNNTVTNNSMIFLQAKNGKAGADEASITCDVRSISSGVGFTIGVTNNSANSTDATPSYQFLILN